MKQTLTRICAFMLTLTLLLSIPVSVRAAEDEPYWGSSSDHGDGTFDNDACVDSDTPDPDIIRVGDAFYMTSTSMHFSPGVPIMKSYDLVNWKVVSYVYNVFDDYDQLALRGGKYDYGKGSWATSLRYREYDHKFYLSHTCNTTNKTYFYRTDDIENGTWEQIVCNTFYHDGSMLFEGENIYMFSGSGTISVDKLKPDFSGSEWKKSIITGEMTTNVCGANNTFLEATHAYKVGDTYYVFMCTWPSGRGKQQLVFQSKVVDGPYEGKVIIDDSYGRSEGLAQGGIVDMVDGSTQTTGKWMGFFMHLRGAAGRGLALTPCTFDANGWPVVANSSGKAARSERVDVPVKGEFRKESVVESTDFDNGETRPAWTYQMPKNQVEPDRYAYNGSNLPMGFEWNHMPDNRLWSLTERDGYLRLTNGETARSVTDCRNVLTARTFGPQCWGHVAMEIDGMKNGDIAGFGAFHRSYGYLAVKMESGRKYIIYRQRDGDSQDASFSNSDPWIEDVMCELAPDVSRVYFKTWFDYRTYRNEYAHFYYSVDGETWVDSGKARKVEFGYPTHFDGCRFGMFNFSTQQAGGYVDFDYFELGDGMPKDVADPTERLASAIRRAEKLAEEDWSQATWSVLAQALSRAKAVYSDPAAAQEDLDEAYAALKDAMAGLETNPRKVLAQAIEAANSLDEADYIPGSWAKLRTELTKATALYQDPAAGEEDCAAQARALHAAMKSLVYQDAPEAEYFADGSIDNDGWTVQREDKETYSVEPGKGLVMPTQRYDIYGDGHDAWKNLFVMPAKGDWQAVAKVVYPKAPVENYQQAMMVVWQDEDNYIRMNCQQSNLKLEPGVETNGSFSGDGFQQPNANASADGSVTLYFMIEKQGSVYTVGYSQDGKRFTVLGTANKDYENPCIGFTATANTDEGANNPIDTYVEYVYLIKRSGQPEETYDEMRLWAAQNVADYIANALPGATDEDLPALLPAPHGYTVELSSSDPAVISADRKVKQNDQEHLVRLTITASDGETTATTEKVVTVPAKGAPALDKAALNGTILLAVMLDPEIYTDETAKMLTDALGAAQTAMAEAQTQEEVDAAEQALLAAINNLERKPPLDKTALETAIEEAEKLDPEAYTEESAHALAEALEVAKKALTDARTQDELDAAKQALDEAVAALVEKTEPTPTPTPGTGLPCDGGDSCPGKVFTDMPAKGNWAHDPIDWAIVNKITAGATKTTFAPAAGCTRAQVVTFLWRAAGQPEPKSTATAFTDLKADGYYIKAVAWAVEKGITAGVTKDKFAPNNTCTRGQIVTFLYRYAGSPEPGQTASRFDQTTPCRGEHCSTAAKTRNALLILGESAWAFPGNDLVPRTANGRPYRAASMEPVFTDVPDNAFYAKAVAWAVENEVTAGISKDKFAPNNTCTRAQVVTFLYRVAK